MILNTNALKNITIYEKFGFKVLEERSIDANHAQKPKFYLMGRDIEQRAKSSYSFILLFSSSFSGFHAFHHNLVFSFGK
jgi:hypothetical protein